MRLLLDENLSEAILPALSDVYPGSLHVRPLGAGGAADGQVWQLARQHSCVLVTRDEDFVRLSIVLGAPPKVVWLNIGNSRNDVVVRLLRERHTEIERFVAQDEATFLAVGG